MRHGIHGPHSIHDAAHLAVVLAVLAAVLGMTILAGNLAFNRTESGPLMNTRQMMLTPLPR
jgi:hypothetical protein